MNKGRLFDGMNPLLKAIMGGNQLEEIEILLGHVSIDVNYKRHTDGATPLFLAAVYGQDSGMIS